MWIAVSSHVPRTGTFHAESEDLDSLMFLCAGMCIRATNNEAEIGCASEPELHHFHIGPVVEQARGIHLVLPFLDIYETVEGQFLYDRRN
jgi:hypothetical protein